MSVPSVMKKASVEKLSENIFESISVVTVPIPELKPDEVLIKNRYVGVNASDLNSVVGSGVYKGNSLPFDIGLEGIGEIVKVGSNVVNFKVNQPVTYISQNAFAEYTVNSTRLVFPIGEVNPEILLFPICGMTAAIGLSETGQIKPGERVLITAAAGGTGHIAVQWAKNAGCHVIGTCSSEEKVQFLKSIGCDRPINYKEEDLDQVLEKEYPSGVDVIWETVGAQMVEKLFKHLAVKGRLIIVGAISTYGTSGVEGIFPQWNIPDAPRTILYKSLAIRGFFLRNHLSHFEQYFPKLMAMHAEKKIRVQLDFGSNTKEGNFIGVESVTRAMDHLHKGKNTGKVIVKL